MKKFATVTILLTVILSTFSCKSTSKSNEKESKTTQTDSKETIYDMNISFISKASGIDTALKIKVDNAIETFNKTNKTSIKPEIVHWGREGETDYDFTLKNLSTVQKKAFTSSIEETIGSSDMAHITFNKKSVHKR